MSQALNLNTILAQAGVKTDATTGALTTIIKSVKIQVSKLRLIKF